MWNLKFSKIKLSISVLSVIIIRGYRLKLLLKITSRLNRIKIGFDPFDRYLFILGGLVKSIIALGPKIMYLSILNCNMNNNLLILNYSQILLLSRREISPSKIFNRIPLQIKSLLYYTREDLADT